jgi:hypothetical protein
MATYTELLAAAQRSPELADYTALRMAYAASPEYAPYGLVHSDNGLWKAINVALKQDDLAAVVQACNRLLDKYALDLKTHMIATWAHDRLGNSILANHHTQFGQGVLKSLMESGDGLSFETAFVVIDIREEYFILQLLGAEMKVQALAEHQGSWFDIFSVVITKTQQEASIYCNIDLCKTWLNSNSRL